MEMLCGEVFASTIQVEPWLFEKMRLDRLLERCFAGGGVSWFERGDYSYRVLGTVDPEHPGLLPEPVDVDTEG